VENSIPKNNETVVNKWAFGCLTERQWINDEKFSYFIIDSQDWGGGG
jgi:hypothetical protein